MLPIFPEAKFCQYFQDILKTAKNYVIELSVIGKPYQIMSFCFLRE